MPAPSFDVKHYPYLIKIGLNIAYYRKLAGLTQEELAEKSNLSITTISYIEASDKHYGMALSSLFKISDALNIPIMKLFDFRDEP